MAIIRDTSSDQRYPLRAHHTFGRSAGSVDTLITSPIASRIHVALAWNGKGWLVRDLSKNGTWLGTRRLAAGENIPVQAGDSLHFGAPDAPAWELEDDTPPRSALVASDHDSTDIDLEPFVFLPDQSQPLAVIIYSYHQHNWMLHYMEQEQASAAGQALAHGDEITVGDASWQVFLAESEQATVISPPSGQLEELEFVFDLSLNEENTNLQLRQGQQLIDLGERSHHYLLLHLARQRAQEASEGLDAKSQGWIDNEQLKRDLGLEMSHINIMIYRARKQLAESLPAPFDSEPLIERGKGRMRFGCPNFRIFKGEQLTYALPAASAKLN